MKNISRRNFIQIAGASAATLAVPGVLSGCSPATQKSAIVVPSYLQGYEQDYLQDPRQASLNWFKEAGFGLFLHYGLYSMLGGEYQGRKIVNKNKPDQAIAEWIQWHGKINVSDYAKLKDNFTAARFDADYITDLALAAGMKYINITTRHHDSFCLFESKYTDFHSVNSPARRDLVAELSEQCQKKGLGFFLYYSHGRDWKHPHAPTNNDWGVTARPRYGQKQPEYLAEGEENLAIYAEFMQNQVSELLTNYGPIAGIWLDGEGVPKVFAKKYDKIHGGGGLDKAIELLKVNELYAKIRELQPNTLISYKKGLTGTEDFVAPERKSFGLDSGGKAMEICSTLQAHSWGYNKFTPHRLSAEQVLETYNNAQKHGANLLLNSGPMGDGSIVKEEAETLKQMGNLLRQQRNA
ncbi:alpha-L-fucosidase [Thalassotalea fonticola]|uniref:alpha-L-fucosidase n=1 Tax=Thalassotalea fonticola TaxID=3065649 RepID=A0ABZ0GQB4_9GAMM|nr:alpha-L-fucosidase [Colwelliaceae bacterium S1-1]